MSETNKARKKHSIKRLGRPPRKWRQKFLEGLKLRGIVTGACQEAGVTRCRAYKERAENPEFAELWEEAIEAAADRLEAEAWRRAHEGDDKPIGFYKGEPGAYVKEYSDTLMIFLLKGMRPEKYRENVHVDQNVKSQSVVVIDADFEEESGAEAELPGRADVVAELNRAAGRNGRNGDG